VEVRWLCRLFNAISGGATPCLIVFATAVKTSNNHLLATGSHLVDVASYNYSYGAIEDMIDTLENEGVGQISFYVVGGEVGCNTNPSPTLTMDYSRYYPFFDAASDQDVTFVGQNFPSNPDGTTTTSAAISANGQILDGSHINILAIVKNVRKSTGNSLQLTLETILVCLWYCKHHQVYPLTNQRQPRRHFSVMVSHIYILYMGVNNFCMLFSFFRPFF